MENVCIPMHLDAFALSPDCCDGNSRIAPYTQPNYTALRLDSHLIQHDVLDHVDFHNTSPANKNPRVADLGQKAPNNLKRHRMGIHLHWSLPRFYRTGTANATNSTTSSGSAEPTNPVFPKIPNRYLITRHIKNPNTTPLPEFQSWILESDAVRNLTDIGDDVDLESDVSPFVSYEGDANSDNVLKAQSEIFLGQKFDLPGWKEASATTHRPLTLMNSSNPLFPDYALHNTNVLSVLDDLSYKAKSGDNTVQYVDNVTCDYFVIGWHDSPNDDPFTASTDSTLASRLSTLMLQLDDSNAEKYGAEEGQTRCLVFSSIYDVKYNFSQKAESVADKGAFNFTKHVKMEPLSVGTTPLDSILTFLSAHETDADSIFETEKGTGNTLAEDITNLAQFLYASSDEYDARVQAQDLMAHQSYAKNNGGFKWTYAKPPEHGNTPAVPSPSEIQNLTILNELQSKLDTSKRQLRTLRWELFAEWWKYVSEYIPDVQKLNRQAFYRPIVAAITNAIRGQDRNSGLIQTVSSLDAQIKALQSDFYKSAVRAPFFTRTDPTLCIAGLNSGRPDDFLDAHKVLLDHELSNDTTSATAIFTGASNPVPADHGLQATTLKILAQCLANSSTQNGVKGSPQTTGFQAWGNKNPFIPLFIEWESMYYHVGIDKWDVQLQSTPWGHNHSFVRYVPTSMLSDGASNQVDFRSLSGRVLVLPQPIFSLENVVKSVLDNPPPGATLASGEADFIRANIRKMRFISAPLSGLTNHLLTRCDGAHVKPVVRVQGQKIKPLAIASASSKDIGITSDVLSLVDSESALTPYGNLMTFGTDTYPKDKNPFKPVTHGQMIFTKLNIIDKFGQAICLPSPLPRLRNDPHPPDSNIYPCISDYLAPNVIGTTVNTVFPTPDHVQADAIPPCEFIQLPPAINQDARINAAFLTRDTISPGEYSPWREATEYESPVWGWIIINYADSGLQFFLADGTFYRELRLGGPNSINVSPKWLPNDPPALVPTDAATAQLDKLIDQLSPTVNGTADYLQTFSDMINGSIVNMPFPPSDYSGYANAIVGKPLALVNAGWSIELAAPAIKPQNSLGNRTSNAQADLEAYSFPLKIGDIERAYDGVVGYYMSSNSGTTSATDWSKLYTYFLPTPNSKFQDVTKPSKSILPNLHPYWLDPTTTPNLTSAHAAKYTVTSLLIDPYTSIHAFSPILPTKSLTLPTWTIQTAFQKMHAFFHLGPMLNTVDVPRTVAEAKVEGVSVKMPVSGKEGTWKWWQPYEKVGVEDVLEPEYGEMDVQEGVVGEKWIKGPYTFLEGYLQLMGSLEGVNKSG